MALHLDMVEMPGNPQLPQGTAGVHLNFPQNITFGQLPICASNIWLLAAMFNINIIVSHIKGSDNRVIDLLL